MAAVTSNSVSHFVQFRNDGRGFDGAQRGLRRIESPRAIAIIIIRAARIGVRTLKAVQARVDDVPVDPFETDVHVKR